LTERLTHLDAEGSARMVDVGAKEVTRRTARARAVVRMSAQTAAAVAAGDAPKGDVLGTARLAGIQAAKRTGDLIPLCHPIGLDHVDVTATVTDDAVVLEATASVSARTGVDMVKGVDRGVTIEEVQLMSKSGGRGGDWSRD
jgi:cyclic pyranopterin phosphate synthase